MSLAQVLAIPAAAADERFATLERRLQNKEQLDAAVQEATQAWDGGAATAARLFQPTTVEADNGEQLYIADSGDNQIQEVARTAHTEWGQSMTANDIYGVAGTRTAGFAGSATGARSAAE